ASGVGGQAIAGALALTYSPGGDTAPVGAGAYVATVTFTSADPNYANAATTKPLTVNRATPTLTVTGGAFGFNGLPHPATATATGIAAASIPGSFAVTYAPGGLVAPILIGDYTVQAAFTSTDSNYT